MSKKWPEMVVEPDMCSQFYIETVYTKVVQVNNCRNVRNISIKNKSDILKNMNLIEI